MIKDSDNAAANSVFADLGGRSAVVPAEPEFGISARTTSPLDAKSRAYALGLMGNVEADQRWGVPAAADAGTTSAVKNGWLAVDDDDGLWAVNSDGVLTVDGDRVLISALTQPEDTERDGVDLVQSLAEAAVVAG